MACNVFGDPITKSTLMGMPEYKSKRIDRKELARVALNMKNVGEKDVKARAYVENLKNQYGEEVCTLCLVYNATGDTIIYSTSNNWWGHIGQSPCPATIANGQWGAFLHLSAAIFSISAGAVVYNGTNNNGDDRCWLLAWSNSGNEKTKVYAESQKAGHYGLNGHWIQNPTIDNCLDKSGTCRNEKADGCLSVISTGTGSSPIVEAILALYDTPDYGNDNHGW